tara:strand:- start:360 stop:758 length:399 start_codon:yes stop_codon:yes gene_type:complete
MNHKLTFLYDGECPLCLRETKFLINKDINNNILFVDISNKEYNPNYYLGISYKDAMENLHGILDSGKIIKGLDVLSYAYNIIGLGWIYSPLRVPYISNFLRLIYKFWAKYRLSITGRSNLEKICSNKCMQIK